jgi:DNA repair protein RadC
LTAESILKKSYSDRKKRQQETEKTAFPSQFKGARCKVCLVKENDQLPPVLINNAERAYGLVKDELVASDRETLLSIMLDTGLYLIGIETVAMGSINVCGSTVSELFRSAILASAAKIILLHNHPSGSLDPSSADIEFTRNAIRCGNLLGIKLQDHIVVSSRGYVSMNERGLINVNEKPF